MDEYDSFEFQRFTMDDDPEGNHPLCEANPTCWGRVAWVVTMSSKSEGSIVTSLVCANHVRDCLPFDSQAA